MYGYIALETGLCGASGLFAEWGKRRNFGGSLISKSKKMLYTIIRTLYG